MLLLSAKCPRPPLADGRTPHERRFGVPFKGPVIPCGSMVEYHPFSAKDQSRLHQFGKKVLPGIFLGYELIAGNLEGDILVEDIEELEKMGATKIHLRRINAKTSIDATKERRLYIPNSRWHSKIFRKRPRIPRTTLRREQPVGIEDLSGDLQGEPEGPQPTESKMTLKPGETSGRQGDGVTKAGQKQAAADPRGSRTCTRREGRMN